MFKCVYKNSPLHLPKSMWPNANKSPNNSPSDRAQTPINGSRSEEMKNADTNGYEFRSRRDRRNKSSNFAPPTSFEEKNEKPAKKEYSCICGRLCRTSYNLYVHQLHNKCGRNNLTENSDRVSGVGINLKIKKKNDSYEVINTTNGDKSNTKDSYKSKDNDFLVDSPGLNPKNYIDQIIVNGRSAVGYKQKYGKNHIILKLKSAEDDGLVNIEDVSDAESLSKRSEQARISKNGKTRKTEETNGVAVKKCEPTIRKGTNESINDEHASSKSSDNVPQDQGHNTEIICTCGKKCSNLWILHKHIARVHPLFLTCGYCKTNLHSLKDYNTHECSAKGTSFDMSLVYLPCHRCFVLLKDYEAFDVHNRTKHPASTIEYKCFVCYASYSTPELRLLHMARVHDENDCAICGKTVRSYFRPVHEGYHHGLGLPCHKCKTAFSTENQLQRHKHSAHKGEAHDENAKVNQTSTGKTENRNAGLITFVSISTGPETCSVCKKVFLHGKSLRMHIAVVHPSSYPWLQCDECGVFTATKSMLDYHAQTKHCLKTAKK